MLFSSFDKKGIAIGMQDVKKAISIRMYTQSDMSALEVKDCREIMESHSSTITVTSKGTGRDAPAMVKFKM
jgi:hypothetical protein